MSGLADRIEALQSELDDLRAVAEEQEATPSGGLGSVEMTGEIARAAEAFAQAIAKAQGHELPLRLAEGGALPILNIDTSMLAGLGQFQKYGGVGIAVVVAPPTEEAAAAA